MEDGNHDRACWTYQLSSAYNALELAEKQLGVGNHNKLILELIYSRNKESIDKSLLDTAKYAFDGYAVTVSETEPKPLQH